MTSSKRSSIALIALPLLASAQPWPFDSRNLTAADWACATPQLLPLSFALVPSYPGPASVSCGTEVLWNSSTSQGASSRPTIVFPPADPTLLYTLLVLDRDATSAALPVRSPLIHGAYVNVPGNMLQSTPGFGPASSGSAVALFGYSGPMPPSGTLCHRYYTFLYSQTAGQTPALNVTQVGRFNFNFPEWANANGLTRVASNFWNTQNAGARTGPCDSAPSASPTPQQNGAGEVSVHLATAAAMAIATFMLTSSCC
jgi:hypothetical protein